MRKDFTVARYRFVPIGSGTVHATLEPILEETDAGVPELAPPADAFVAPPPPPTVVTPADAASPNKLPF